MHRLPIGLTARLHPSQLPPRSKGLIHRTCTRTELEWFTPESVWGLRGFASARILASSGCSSPTEVGVFTSRGHPG